MGEVSRKFLHKCYFTNDGQSDIGTEAGIANHGRLRTKEDDEIMDVLYNDYIAGEYNFQEFYQDYLEMGVSHKVRVHKDSYAFGP